MARDFFKNLPNTTTPLTAPRLNALLDGDEAMGNIVVDSIRGKNLFNKNDLNNNMYIPTNSTSEDLAPTNNTYTTKWISCKASTTYRVSGTNINRGRVQYKNSSGTITYAGSDISGPYNITTRSDTVYFRIYFYSGSDANFDDIQIEQGSTTTNYAEYVGLGYISGSNANGSYIKYDDGTLICWNEVILNSVPVTNTWGGMYISNNLEPFGDFPYPFKTVRPALSIQGLGEANTQYYWIIKSNGHNTTTIRGIRFCTGTSITLTNAKISYIAIGRWK